ncbi:hypothetical protein GGF32_003629 [Allomyces javanicus]|nr:hypothetical protein GGF32_003629 [Allomyces javanicus]
MSNLPRRKAVFIGAPATGKSALIMAHCEKRFPVEYHPRPTVITDKPDLATVTYRKDGRQCALELWDTPGQEDVIYKVPIDASACWILEARHFCPTTPVVLVGTHRDVRDLYERQLESSATTLGDEEEWSAHLVTTAEGDSLRRTINAAAFIETSAKTMSEIEIEAVFSKIARVAMGEHKLCVAQLLEKSTKCCLVM